MFSHIFTILYSKFPINSYRRSNGNRKSLLGKHIVITTTGYTEISILNLKLFMSKMIIYLKSLSNWKIWLKEH